MIDSFNDPIFSQMEKGEASQNFRLFIQDLLSNWELYGINPQFEFSRDWFDSAARMANAVLQAERSGNPRTGRRVSRQAAQSQKRIARAILQRIESAKRALDAGDGTNVNRCGAQIFHLFARMMAEPDRVRGYRLACAESEGGKTERRSIAEKSAQWQREAEKIWSRRPRLSVRAVAWQIDKFKVERIRKVIKRPNKPDK